MATPGFRRRLIMMKHVPEPIETIEANPFVGAESTLERLNAKGGDATAIKNRGARTPAPQDPVVYVFTPFGKGRLLDISEGGVKLHLSTYLAKGVTLELHVANASPMLHAALAELEIERIEAEVRWGEPVGDGYVHGLKLKNLAPRQARGLVETVRRLGLESGTSAA